MDNNRQSSTTYGLDVSRMRVIVEYRDRKSQPSRSKVEQMLCGNSLDMPIFELFDRHTCADIIRAAALIVIGQV